MAVWVPALCTNAAHWLIHSGRCRGTPPRVAPRRTYIEWSYKPLWTTPHPPPPLGLNRRSPCTIFYASFVGSSKLPCAWELRNYTYLPPLKVILIAMRERISLIDCLTLEKSLPITAISRRCFFFMIRLTSGGETSGGENSTCRLWVRTQVLKWLLCRYVITNHCLPT